MQHCSTRSTCVKSFFLIPAMPPTFFTIFAVGLFLKILHANDHSGKHGPYKTENPVFFGCTIGRRSGLLHWCRMRGVLSVRSVFPKAILYFVSSGNEKNGPEWKMFLIFLSVRKGR